ncbi:Uncharacterised protein [Mycobacteroides abscessus]|nr:Uncharacterised protein [Mycobacteroides abscessus]
MNLSPNELIAWLRTTTGRDPGPRHGRSGSISAAVTGTGLPAVSVERTMIRCIVARRSGRRGVTRSARTTSPGASRPRSPGSS